MSRTRLETLQFAVGAILNMAEDGLLADSLERDRLADVVERRGMV